MKKQLVLFFLISINLFIYSQKNQDIIEIETMKDYVILNYCLDSLSIYTSDGSGVFRVYDMKGIQKKVFNIKQSFYSFYVNNGFLMYLRNDSLFVFNNNKHVLISKNVLDYRKINNKVVIMVDHPNNHNDLDSVCFKLYDTNFNFISASSTVTGYNFDIIDDNIICFDNIKYALVVFKMPNMDKFEIEMPNLEKYSLVSFIGVSQEYYVLKVFDKLLKKDKLYLVNKDFEVEKTLVIDFERNELSNTFKQLYTDEKLMNNPSGNLYYYCAKERDVFILRNERLKVKIYKLSNMIKVLY